MIFVGFAACFKTSVGKIVARRIAADFYDTDALVEQSERRFVRQIICDSGEEYFRQAENAVLARLSDVDNAVVSCGGGSVLCDNFAQFARNATVVWLTASPATVRKRLDGTSRPLFDNASELQLRRIMEQRAPLYAKYADFCINTDDSTPQQVADAVANNLSNI